MNTKINSWIYQFSFFEFIGLITFGVIISNYFLDKPLINIGVFFVCCLIGLGGSLLKFYMNYKNLVVSKDLKINKKN
jgi:uncharacterized membrane protein YcaP (DUF421 family)